MVQSPNPRRPVIFCGKMKTSQRPNIYISSPIGWVAGCTAKMTFNPKKGGCSELPEKLAGQFEVQRSCQINKVANINCDIAS
jgi:hypothetical protein